MGETVGQDRRRWYVVMTKPGGEERVTEQLRRRLGIETYVPRIEMSIRRGRSSRMVVRPLFPNYLFASLLLPLEWKTITYTRGVTRILGGWTEPKPVADEVVEAIKARERQPDKIIQYYNFHPQDPVHVRQGPMRDLYGIFERYTDDKGRVRVLLSLIGYQASVELDASCLEKI